MNKVIYAAVMGADSLSRNEKLFLSDLISFTQSNEYAFASNAYFARQYSVTIRTINRWLEKLKKLELIKTRLVRYAKSYIVKKRYIYVNMEKVNALKGIAGTTDTLISGAIQYSKAIPKSEKLMLAVLVKYSQTKGYVYASDDHFAKIFGVHRATVRRWLKKLAASDYIRIDHDRFLRRIFLLLQSKKTTRHKTKCFSFFMKCKNVMYSVTSILQARIKRLLYILCNLMHIHFPKKQE